MVGTTCIPVTESILHFRAHKWHIYPTALASQATFCPAKGLHAELVNKMEKERYSNKLNPKLIKKSQPKPVES